MFTKDGFNQDITIGDIITHTCSKNGITTNFKGKIINITDKNNITVEVIERYKAIYTHNVEVDDFHRNKTTSCKANNCVKINNLIN